MSLKSLLAGCAALAVLMPHASVAEGWNGLSAPVATAPAAPAFDPAAPPAGTAAQPFLLSAPSAAPGAPAAAAPKPQAAVDESALRYYASKNDVARVAAEIRRLRALHPDWQPPEDLFSASASATVDLKPLWDLFAAQRYDDLRAAIEQMKATTPGFQPPAELIEKLNAAQARDYLIKASDLQDYPRVLGIARNYQGLLSCADLDVMWRVAEALARSGEAERAFGAYDYILTNCEGAPERLATVQKASQVLPDAAIRTLMARGRTAFDGTSEFEPLLLDMVRRRIGEAIPAAETADADPADIARLSAAAKASRSAGDANLLGWYQFAEKRFADAELWFRQAADWSDDPKSTEGLILALRGKGEQAAAEALALENRTRSPEIAKIYIETISAGLTAPEAREYPADRLAAFQQAVEEASSALGAQSLGWYLFNRGAVETAAVWFDKSLAWQESAEAALGRTLAAQRLGDRNGFKTLTATYGPKYPAIATLASSSATADVEAAGQKLRVSVPRKKSGGGGGAMVREAVALYEAKRYREAADALEKVRSAGRESHDLTVLRGWAYYNARQFAKAKETFAKADAKRSTRDTRTGLYYATNAQKPRIFE